MVCLLTVKSSRKCLGISNSRARSLQLCWSCFSLRLRDYPLTLHRRGAPLAAGLWACDCREGPTGGQGWIWGALQGAAAWIQRGWEPGRAGEQQHPWLSTPELLCPSLRDPTGAAGHPRAHQQGRFDPHKGFFAGGEAIMSSGWQEQSSNTPQLERGGLRAQQGAQGCREV